MSKKSRSRVEDSTVVENDVQDVLDKARAIVSPKGDERDWFLQNIIGAADLGVEMGVTLTVGGSTVSGTLISGRTYFTEISDLLRSAESTSDEAKIMLNGLADSWGSLSKLYDQPDDEVDNWSRVPPGYIHLRNARIYVPGGESLPSGSGGLLWRGRLVEIDGFAIGVLTAA